ncbi:MAG TPA: hypothetical protein VL094_08645 [Sphingomonadaceae bacterium]|nr:hypothetical protein [Sphingomonadaceae bacterium]
MGQMQHIAARDGFNARTLCAASVDSGQHVFRPSQSITDIVPTSFALPGQNVSGKFVIAF